MGRRIAVAVSSVALTGPEGSAIARDGELEQWKMTKCTFVVVVRERESDAFSRGRRNACTRGVMAVHTQKNIPEVAPCHPIKMPLSMHGLHDVESPQLDKN